MLNLSVHPDLPALVSLLSQSHTAAGAAGERLVQIALEKAGYSVTPARSGDHAGDLRAITPDGEILRVEVKTARVGFDGKYRFHLCAKKHTDHRNSDVLVMLCVLTTGYVIPFVVPVPALANVRSCTVCKNPRSYAGKLAKYRQRLEKLDLQFEAIG